jgi:N-acetyl-alpha-D-muramate 1-phosphate uridylyltransferase
MKAMLFAAGLGTRLKPFTDTHPKALAMINGKSLLQRNIEFLQFFGINDIIVNVHHFADQVITTIIKNDGYGSNITISDESSQILETGGGLKKAGWFFADSELFVVMNVDILTDIDIRLIINAHLQKRPLATLAVTDRNTSRYFLFDEFDNLCGWKNERTGEQKMSREIKDYSQKAFSGIHIISPEIFTLMIHVSGIHDKEKFSLVDVYLELAKTNSITAFDHSNSKFIDVGKPASIAQAETMFE